MLTTLAYGAKGLYFSAFIVHGKYIVPTLPSGFILCHYLLNMTTMAGAPNTALYT